MKFDPAKAWPHPVLRPSSYGDDYPHAEFEVDIEVGIASDRTFVHVRADFELSDPGLSRLVLERAAHYVLLIKAPRTHFRHAIRSPNKTVTETFPGGALSGRVEFAPFLICSQSVPSYNSRDWHADFRGLSFDLTPGVVLAEDVPKDYWIDTADEAPLGSIFAHKERPDLPIGRWEYELRDDHIWIVMSTVDTERYARARDFASDRPEAQYLMNGLYLPALMAVLSEVDQNTQEYRHTRWFTSLDHRLEEVGCQRLGSIQSNRRRLVDAQKILDSPFSKMPLIAES